MAVINLSWIAPEENSEDQLIQYKKASSSTWITFSTVPSVNTFATITGLEDNVIYDVRVVNNCLFGEAASIKSSVINIICPQAIYDSDRVSISYNLILNGESIDSYNIYLLDNDNNILDSKIEPYSNPLNGSFTGLNPGTTYKIRIIVNSAIKNQSCYDYTIATNDDYPFKWIVDESASYCEQVLEVFHNVQKSGVFTRNNCGVGYAGGQATYTVPAGTYNNTISQANVDNLAQTDVNTNGQAYANINGSCTIILVGNDALSGPYTRNNCPAGYTGSTVIAGIAANSFMRPTKAEANAAAQAQLDIDGQAVANSTGTCTQVLFGNVRLEQAFTRNNCGTGYVGNSVLYVVAANTYTASSQLAADNLAQNDINTNGQNNANTYGTCTYVFVGNQRRAQNFTRNNCPDGQTGSSIEYAIEANTYYAATVSEANAQADAQIAANGQSYANTNAGCNTVPPATINYEFNKSNNPTVDIILVSTDNGNYLANIYGTSAGTIGTITAGHTLYAGMAHDVENIPWPLESKAVMSLYKDGVPIYYSGEITDPTINDLAHTSVVVESGSTYTIYMTSSSTATFYNAVDLTMINNSSLPLASGAFRPVLFTIYDQTDNTICLKTGQEITPQAGVGFNAYTDSNNLLITVDINSPVTQLVDITVTNPFGYSRTIYNVGNNTTTVFDNVPKTSITISYVNSTDSAIYYNKEHSQNFTKNNCAEGQTGSSVAYTVYANTYSSGISQIDADLQALSDISINGQNYANLTGVCTGAHSGTLIANKTFTVISYLDYFDTLIRTRLYNAKLSIVGNSASLLETIVPDYPPEQGTLAKYIFLSYPDTGSYHPTNDTGQVYISIQSGEGWLSNVEGDPRGFVSNYIDIAYIFASFPEINEFSFRIQMTKVQGPNDSSSLPMYIRTNSKVNKGKVIKINSSLPADYEIITNINRNVNSDITFTIVKTSVAGVYDIYYQ